MDENTNAIGIVVKKGKYGGTYAFMYHGKRNDTPFRASHQNAMVHLRAHRPPSHRS
jgi:hypothetical protein